MKICAVDSCDKRAKARGWCDKHLSRWYRNGDPLGGGTPKDGTVPRYFYEVVIPFVGDECLVWPFARDKNGYGKIEIDAGSGLVHRRACEEVHGPPPEGDIHAAHSCGNGHLGCCNPSHLRWAPRSSNELDKIEHGTSNRGSRHGMSVLSEHQVLEIRSLKGLVNQAALATRFGVSARTISDIHRRRSWAWLAPSNDNVPPEQRRAA